MLKNLALTLSFPLEPSYVLQTDSIDQLLLFTSSARKNEFLFRDGIAIHISLSRTKNLNSQTLNFVVNLHIPANIVLNREAYSPCCSVTSKIVIDSMPNTRKALHLQPIKSNLCDWRWMLKALAEADLPATANDLLA